MFVLIKGKQKAFTVLWQVQRFPDNKKEQAKVQLVRVRVIFDNALGLAWSWRDPEVTLTLVWS